MANRFWSKVNKAGPTQPHMKTRCWVWLASLDKRGYGQYHLLGRTVRAHHAAWYEVHRKLPAKCLLHRCDNPACVRPSHLVEGTQQDNIKDMLRKGRGSGGKGESHGKAKLTEATVRSIRQEYRTGTTSYLKLAAKYGVGDDQICRIVQRKLWKHVKE